MNRVVDGTHASVQDVRRMLSEAEIRWPAQRDDCGFDVEIGSLICDHLKRRAVCPWIFKRMREVAAMADTTTTVFDLSPSEKLQLVEDLWDDLCAIPEQVPLHEEQVRELDRRKSNLQAHPESGLSWTEVQRRIRSRYGR